MFQQDHRADFEAVLAAREPFALMRFGDGELALISGVAHQSADAWATKGPVWLRDELIGSLRTREEGIYLGLPSPCCISRGTHLRLSVRLPLERQTFATLFMHGNLPRAYEVQQHFSDAVVVNDKYGDVRVPGDGVSKRWDVDAVVTKLQEVRDRPILLAAGPCSNLIAMRYWSRQAKDLRVPIVDVGSMLDVLHGHVSRHYHGTMNHHHCQWDDATTRPRSGPRSAVQIGRKSATRGVRKIQRGPKRIRLGKS